MSVIRVQVRGKNICTLRKLHEYSLIFFLPIFSNTNYKVSKGISANSSIWWNLVNERLNIATKRYVVTVVLLRTNCRKLLNLVHLENDTGTSYLLMILLLLLLRLLLCLHDHGHHKNLIHEEKSHKRISLIICPKDLPKTEYCSQKIATSRIWTWFCPYPGTETKTQVRAGLTSACTSAIFQRAPSWIFEHCSNYPGSVYNMQITYKRNYVAVEYSAIQGSVIKDTKSPIIWFLANDSLLTIRNP